MRADPVRDASWRNAAVNRWIFGFNLELEWLFSMINPTLTVKTPQSVTVILQKLSFRMSQPQNCALEFWNWKIRLVNSTLSRKKWLAAVYRLLAGFSI